MFSPIYDRITGTWVNNTEPRDANGYSPGGAIRLFDSAQPSRLDDTSSPYHQSLCEGQTKGDPVALEVGLELGSTEHLIVLMRIVYHLG